MDGLEDLIEDGLHAFSELFSSSSDTDDGSIDNIIEAVSNIDYSIDSVFSGNDIDSFSESMEDALNSALLENLNPEIGDNSDISFTGMSEISHHLPGGSDEINDPMVLHSNDELNENQDISFTGKGDKYSDDEFNEKLAKEHLEQEEYLREKGDNKAADAAHGQAKDHLRRIKKK